MSSFTGAPRDQGQVSELDYEKGIGFIYVHGYTYQFDLQRFPDARVGMLVEFEGAEGWAVDVKAVTE